MFIFLYAVSSTFVGECRPSELKIVKINFKNRTGSELTCFHFPTQPISSWKHNQIIQCIYIVIYISQYINERVLSIFWKSAARSASADSVHE